MPKLEVRTKQQVYYTEVDQEDYERFVGFKWHLDSKGYVYRNKPDNGRRKPSRLHREIMGADDPAILIDHKDRNRLNNKRTNLRAATKAQNAMNSQPKRRVKATSQMKGVTWRRGRWRMTIKLPDGKIIDRLFRKESEAAEAYNDFAKEHFGDFARINVVTQP